MSGETDFDEIWRCPKGGYKIRKVFRSDDWYRREYTEYENGKIIRESVFWDFSHPSCKLCGSLMEQKKKLINSYLLAIVREWKYETTNGHPSSDSRSN
jgi:hypothetical protein